MSSIVSTKSLHEGFINDVIAKKDWCEKTAIQRALVEFPDDAESPENHQINSDELKNIKPFIDGSYSHVFSAEYNDSLVAVKTMLPEHALMPEMVRAFHKELVYLQKTSHESIIHSIGFGSAPSGLPYIVTYLAEGGDLHDICTWKGKPRHEFLSTNEKCIKHSLDLARALHYLHNKAIPGHMILHRDLKGRNIVFTKGGRLKLLDFGLAKVVPQGRLGHETYNLTGEVGTIRYMAPEVYECKPYNQTADTYGWSLLSWQMMANTTPFGQITKFEQYAPFVIDMQHRPKLKDQPWPKAFCRLLRRSWHPKITIRPSMRDIVAALEALLTEMGVDVGPSQAGPGPTEQAGPIPTDLNESAKAYWSVIAEDMVTSAGGVGAGMGADETKEEEPASLQHVSGKPVLVDNSTGGRRFKLCCF